MTTKSQERIFISYSRDDLQAARRLYNDLKARGFNPWLDEEDLLPGVHWEVEIKKAINASRFFIALLSSRGSRRRGFVHREVRQALEVLQEMPEQLIYLIPVRLDPCEVGHERLNELHRVDLFENWERGVERIVHALRLQGVEAQTEDGETSRATTAGPPDEGPPGTTAEETATAPADPEPSPNPLALEDVIAILRTAEAGKPPATIVESRVKPMSVDVFTGAFGYVHRRWLARPFKAAFLAFSAFAGICIFSFALEIAKPFNVPGFEKQANGFMTSLNWGPLFLLILPLCALGVGVFFHFEQDALRSIDKILEPVNGNRYSFTEVMAAKFRHAWILVILPGCLVLSIGLTLLADFNDILAPFGVTPSVDLDWSNAGFLAFPERPPELYGVFNILAFGSQAFAGYCGFLVLFCVAYPLTMFSKYALKNPDEARPKVKPPKMIRDLDFRFHFAVNWDWSGPHGRCGLHRFDRVFLFFVFVILLAVGAATDSVLSQRLSESQIDKGSVILIFCTVLLQPIIFFWVFIPYFINFPSSLPADERGKGYPDPKPWPFGSGALTLVMILLSTSAWGYLFSEGILALITKL